MHGHMNVKFKFRLTLFPALCRRFRLQFQYFSSQLNSPPFSKIPYITKYI